MPSTLEEYNALAKKLHETDYCPEPADYNTTLKEFVDGYVACGGVLPENVDLSTPYAWHRLIQSIAAPKIDTHRKYVSPTAHGQARVRVHALLNKDKTWLV